MNDRIIPLSCVALLLCVAFATGYGQSIFNNGVILNASVHELSSLVNNTGGSVDANINGITDVVDWCASCAGGAGGPGGGVITTQGGSVVPFLRAPSNLQAGFQRITTSADNTLLDGIQMPYTATGRVTRISIIGSWLHARSWSGPVNPNTGQQNSYSVQYVQMPQTNIVIDWQTRHIYGYTWESTWGPTSDYDYVVVYAWDVTNAQSNIDYIGYHTLSYQPQCGSQSFGPCPVIQVDFATKRIIKMPIPSNFIWNSGRLIEYG